MLKLHVSAGVRGGGCKLGCFNSTPGYHVQFLYSVVPGIPVLLLYMSLLLL